MILEAFLITLSTACTAENLDHPYSTMQAGFEAKDPAIVASAYEPEAILGRIDRPEVRTGARMSDTFAYVAVDEGDALAIDFKILYRDQGMQLVGDMGLYRVTGADRSASYGQFTTVLRCGADGVWRFTADLMMAADEEAWKTASCIDGAPCTD